MPCRSPSIRAPQIRQGRGRDISANDEVVGPCWFFFVAHFVFVFSCSLSFASSASFPFLFWSFRCSAAHHFPICPYHILLFLISPSSSSLFFLVFLLFFFFQVLLFRVHYIFPTFSSFRFSAFSSSSSSVPAFPSSVLNRNMEC